MLTGVVQPVRDVDVHISVLAPADVEEATDLLARVFPAREPLTRALAVSRAQFLPFARGVCAAAAGQGLSVVARADGRMVGLRVAEPWPPPDEGAAPPAALAPILEILTRLEQTFDRLYPPDGGTLHMQMMACLPEREGQGLATAMVRETLRLAAGRGLRRAFAEVTHGGSARVFERLGFSTRAEVPYATYTFEGRAVFADVAAVGCRLVVKELAGP